jgi:hypothetical protein
MKTFLTRTKISLLAIAAMFCFSLCTSALAQSTSGDQGAMEPNANQSPSQNTATDQQSPIELVDPGKIYNENPMGWVGKSVVLKNVTVQDTNKSGNFWVGLDNDHRLLVVKAQGNDNLKAMTLHKGDVITVSGTVQAASRYMGQTSSAEMGSMQDAQKSSGVFLMATDVNVNSSTHQ